MEGIFETMGCGACARGECIRRPECDGNPPDFDHAVGYISEELLRELFLEYDKTINFNRYKLASEIQKLAATAASKSFVNTQDIIWRKKIYGAYQFEEMSKLSGVSVVIQEYEYNSKVASNLYLLARILMSVEGTYKLEM